MTDKTATRIRRHVAGPRGADGEAATNSAPAAAVSAASVTVHGAGETQWWFDGRDTNDPQLWSAVEKSNCIAVVINRDQQKHVHTSKQKVVFAEKASQLEHLHEGAWVWTPHEELRVEANKAGHKAGLFIDVENLEGEFPYCIEVCSRGDDFVVIDIEHATYIPYELLLAKTEGKPTRILRTVPIKGLAGTVDDINQSLNAFATMERGVGVLFKTRNSAFWENPRGQFREDFTYVSPGAARALVSRGVRLVGIDYLSVEEFGSKEFETHRVLLSGGVVILEGLDLRAVAPGRYELICLPLKITAGSGDGAPARAVLRTLD